MKIIANYVATADPPLLSLYIHDAPHRRMHIKVIQQYRVFLRAAMARIGVTKEIDVPIDLHVLFVNPATPDLGNAYLALEQALDGSTLTKPGIIADDSLIQETRMAKFFPAKPKK
jgi:hypothetical protein